MFETVLVTGGAGYIGRYVLRELGRAKFVGVWLDVQQGRRDGDLVDMLDLPALQAAIERRRPMGIIHLAGYTSVAESMLDPAKYALNVTMCENLRQAAGHLPIVMASSAAVYGQSDGVAICESVRPRPANPYGASKVASEAALPDAMCLRLFNVAGGSGDLAEHIVPKAVAAALNGQPLKVTGEGSAVRDFVHVEDVAEAFVMALKHLLNGYPPEVLNICTEQTASVNDIIGHVERCTGRTIQREVAPPRAGDVARLEGRGLRAFGALGWRPERNLGAIIGSACEGLPAWA